MSLLRASFRAQRVVAMRPAAVRAYANGPIDKAFNQAEASQGKAQAEYGKQTGSTEHQVRGKAQELKGEAKKMGNDAAKEGEGIVDSASNAFGKVAQKASELLGGEKKP